MIIEINCEYLLSRQVDREADATYCDPSGRDINAQEIFLGKLSFYYMIEITDNLCSSDFVFIMPPCKYIADKAV